jgi:hypothetical protein
MFANLSSEAKQGFMRAFSLAPAAAACTTASQTPSSSAYASENSASEQDDDVRIKVDNENKRSYIESVHRRASRVLRRADSGGADDWAIFRTAEGEKFVASPSQPHVQPMWVSEIFELKALLQLL